MSELEIEVTEGLAALSSGKRKGKEYWDMDGRNQKVGYINGVLGALFKLYDAYPQYKKKDSYKTKDAYKKER